MSDSFAGAWAVREYVFDPGGAALGTVAQRRRVVSRPGGGLRVIQDCVPDPSLAGHPMDEFRGHHEFDLTKQGSLRRYHGPDVVGSAVSYGDGAMLGRGVWTRFGYNFQSWAVMLGPERQLTGGRFSRAGKTMAVIVGIAEPEREGASPSLAEPTTPQAVSKSWAGTSELFSSELGARLHSSLSRAYDAHGFRERGQYAWSIDLSSVDGAFRASGSSGGETVIGFARRYGWVTYIEAASSDGGHVDAIEAFDPASDTLVGFRRSGEGETTTQVEVIRLQAQRGHDE